MKAIVTLFVFAQLVCLSIQGSIHPSKLPKGGVCHLNGEHYPVGKHVSGCNEFTCHEDGHLTSVGCALSACVKEIGYQDTDLSKPYPECCPRPICE